MRPSAMSVAQIGELGEDLLPHLEAARADARADRGRRCADLAYAPSRRSRRQARASRNGPSRRRPGPTSATGRQSATKTSGARPSAEVAQPSTSAGSPPAPRSHAERSLGSSWRTTSAPCTCLPETIPAGSTPSASHISARFAWTVAESSSVRRPRLSESNGPELIPPTRVVNAARAPGSSASSHFSPPLSRHSMRSRLRGRGGRKGDAELFVAR